VLAALGVVAGAFGAHALKLPDDRMQIYDTAARYQQWTALGIMLSARYAGRVLLFAGLVVFCGSLYLLALTDTRWLGAVAPLGGLLLILGWLRVAWTAWKVPTA
jgi:uncharacterized membrane protein YgdD (TMEM256/DUF423 family)